MIIGRPLRYTYNIDPPEDFSGERRNSNNSDLFRPYLTEVHHTTDYYPFTTYVTNMADDMHVPPAHSPQLSDSEGSISSVDSPKQKSLKCCWRNCGIHFGTLDQLASHVGKVHGASGPAGLFYCGWEGCTRNDRAFNARYKMLVHVRTHTNEKPHQCYQCDKSFSRAENLKIHIRSHSGEKPYACPVPGCNKAYSNSSDRFKHTRTHQDDKPYQCKVAGCSKRYTDPSSLRKHVKTYKHYTQPSQQSTNMNQINEEKSSPIEDKYDFKFKENYTWSGLIGSRILPYAMDMDIDAPLDLSISRKT